MLSILVERDVPFSQLRLLASADSAGELYQVGDDEVMIEELGPDSFTDVDIALFATSSNLAEEYVPIATEAGAVAIDNSSHFRMQEGVPLIVPEVNFNILTESDKDLLQNPNCSTIQLVPVLRVIEDLAGLERVVVSTYQSVSGAGKIALDELWGQTLAIFNQKELIHEAFEHQIAFNCIPTDRCNA